jgi:thiamine-phosphate pyrophosphorylase
MSPFYFITDPLFENLQSSLFEVVEQAIAGGARFIQYRDKINTRRVLYEKAKRLREMTRKSGATLIINDHVDLALAVGADGVHLGQDDLPILAARNLLGKTAVIGISTHTLEEATLAQEEGADYIGFGPIFATKTKSNPKAPVGISAILAVKRKTHIPLFAIGGIERQHLSDIFSAGADGVVAISAVAGDMTFNIQEWIKDIHLYRDPSGRSQTSP